MFSFTSSCSCNPPAAASSTCPGFVETLCFHPCVRRTVSVLLILLFSESQLGQQSTEMCIIQPCRALEHGRRQSATDWRSCDHQLFLTNRATIEEKASGDNYTTSCMWAVNTSEAEAPPPPGEGTRLQAEFTVTKPALYLWLGEY